MSRWLGQNLSLLLISILLAFFFWAVAVEAEDPTVERVYGTPIPVEIQGLPENRIKYGQDVNRVQVELRAPRSIWESLTTADINAYIDLSEAPTGVVTAPVQIKIGPQPVRLLSVKPAEITLNIEPFIQREITITVKVNGAPQAGYRMSAPEVMPQVARIQGPASFVQQVNIVQATVEIEGAQSNRRNDYELTALDAEGQPVANVTLLPKSVNINVPVTSLGYIHDLPVNVSLEGQPAAGYRICRFADAPPVIKVYATTRAVNEIPGFLQTQLINIEGLTQTLTATVDLQIPSGLVTIQPTRPTVTAVLSIEAIKSGLKLDIQPEIRGLLPAYTATIGIESVVVILNGPLLIMETLPITAVSLTLDLTNLQPGEYNLAPVVIAPDKIAIQNLLPETVPVKIEKLPTPPTPPPTEDVQP